MMTLMHLRKWDHGAHLSRRGFTLVEVMISVGVLAFVIVGLLQLFVYCSTLADAAGNMTLAVNEAQTKMEEIRDHDFDSIAADYASGGTPGNTFTLSGPSGTGTITVSQVEGSSQLLQVQIGASWQNKDGRSASTTLISYIAKR
jgi:prepilin-type N-terminal cleavage/methylation domain-containing protein